MDVEFDLAKDRENRHKHGISLGQAVSLDERTSMFDLDDSQNYGEVRYNAVGWIKEKLYTLTFTTRGELTRAISLREASREERKRYAEYF